MYVIHAKSSKVEKAFDRLLSPLSDTIKSKIIKTLAISPKTTTSQSSITGKIEKKRKFWQYYVTGGDRIIYDVVDRPKKIVIILFAGNHNDASIFLRNN